MFKIALTLIFQKVPSTFDTIFEFLKSHHQHKRCNYAYFYFNLDRLKNENVLGDYPKNSEK